MQEKPAAMYHACDSPVSGLVCGRHSRADPYSGLGKYLQVTLQAAFLLCQS